MTHTIEYLRYRLGNTCTHPLVRDCVEYDTRAPDSKCVEFYIDSEILGPVFAAVEKYPDDQNVRVRLAANAVNIRNSSHISHMRRSGGVMDGYLRFVEKDVREEVHAVVNRGLTDLEIEYKMLVCFLANMPEAADHPLRPRRVEEMVEAQRDEGFAAEREWRRIRDIKLTSLIWRDPPYKKGISA